ncbi:MULTISPECIES: ATP-binding protein [Thermococcus]|uniref:DEXX-box atpase n=2 Tax=Thermococcus sibiricus TaxID=172049 RepID=C6A322_THESM|nr:MULTISPECIES: ATP-binding protein [Thermococcus]KUK29376.1 MAG: DEXX-box atpase [Thermococcus sp. 40_45]HII66704.1 ATP-binding protein [Thermococcaceae archaeon]ACS90017.1 DEXX-box atpase [Thermococcus sibiricus MM 739]KUK18614.1 MAG: DEXX-box atpase [Thermococcus sibiricus]MBC7095581.1 ATP-binding protein [Thermococcus sp.]
MANFVNRTEELKAIKERLSSDGFELIVIYGRRRVGKTRLVLEAVRDFPHVYYLAVEGDNLRHFKETAERVFPEIRYVHEDWEALLHALRDKIIIIDEFPNLINENPAVLSIFQRVIDTKLVNSNTKLILLGSSVSMMTEKVLSYKSPLYGRRTGSMKLKPLKFFHLKGFFPRASWEELVEVYGMTDGIPFYIAQVRLPFWEWLDRELKSPVSFFRDEVDFLLRYEFTETKTYRRILEAIALGKTTPKEIRDFTGMKHSEITPYLRNLIETGLVVREVPLTEKPNSKRGRYYVADNFIAFWFRFIYPNLSLIEEGVFDVSEIQRDYNHYLGPVFEKIAKQFLVELNKAKKLPFRFMKIGRWWYKSEEVDLLALNERERKGLLVEVKWKELSEREARGILKDLERKAKLVGLEEWENFYGLVAKRIKGKEELKNEGLLVWDLKDFKEV